MMMQNNTMVMIQLCVTNPYGCDRIVMEYWCIRKTHMQINTDKHFYKHEHVTTDEQSLGKHFYKHEHVHCDAFLQA